MTSESEEIVKLLKKQNKLLEKQNEILVSIQRMIACTGAVSSNEELIFNSIRLEAAREIESFFDRDNSQDEEEELL